MEYKMSLIAVFTSKLKSSFLVYNTYFTSLGVLVCAFFSSFALFLSSLAFAHFAFLFLPIKAFLFLC